MCLGEERRIFIPAGQAYGAKGSPPKIPPNADLIFVVILREINGKSLQMVLEEREMKKKSFLVESLPGVDPGVMKNMTMYSGHLELVSEPNAQYFFILTKSKQSKAKNLMIWFNGGPGCSSMDGMFLEVGPLRMSYQKEPASPTFNEKGWWHTDADVVFLDQPAGTGYSVGDVLDSTAKIVQHFMHFVLEFLKVFPEYSRPGVGLYLAGESFAGLWIPYFAQELLLQNYPLQVPFLFYPQAIAIGNGWISPKHQYLSYLPYAEKYGLISGKYLETAKQDESQCLEELDSYADGVRYSKCERIMDTLLEFSRTDGFCRNKYDYSLRDKG
jgi:carboxypeptidase D